MLYFLPNGSFDEHYAENALQGYAAKNARLNSLTIHHHIVVQEQSDKWPIGNLYLHQTVTCNAYHFYSHGFHNFRYHRYRYDLQSLSLDNHQIH